MPSWSQKPYPGAPPPKGIPPLPRPLYPPSAANHGKQPSSKGPDVQAVKRAVSRLGRWPWQKYDLGYWDAFALGDPSSQVGRSGMAGFQRQQHIDPTGWMGRKTYNALAYAVIPDGLPHAREPAFDTTAIGLLQDAFAVFGGHEPDTSKGTVRQAALAHAQGELGYTEGPDNWNKYADWYGDMQNQPWCAIFCTWAFETNPKGPSPSFVKGSRYAYVPYIVGDARAGRSGLTTTDDPVPGDLVCYDWQYNGEYDHIGLFESWDDEGGQFVAIEGNTSTTNNSNGGSVMRRTRHRGSQGTVFVHVQEP